MAHTDYTPQEISARGKALYETKLKAQLEPEHIGKYLVIDIETGDYEMGEDDFGVSQRAYQKNPSGIRFGMRIGFRTSGTLRKNNDDRSLHDEKSGRFCGERVEFQGTRNHCTPAEIDGGSKL